MTLKWLPHLYRGSATTMQHCIPLVPKERIIALLTCAFKNTVESFDKSGNIWNSTVFENTEFWSTPDGDTYSYEVIIRRSIMHAKRDYYRNVFHKYSSSLKKTWQIINESLNRRTIKLKLSC